MTLPRLDVGSSSLPYRTPLPQKSSSGRVLRGLSYSSPSSPENKSPSSESSEFDKSPKKKLSLSDSTTSTTSDSSSDSNLFFSDSSIELLDEESPKTDEGDSIGKIDNQLAFPNDLIQVVKHVRFAKEVKYIDDIGTDFYSDPDSDSDLDSDPGYDAPPPVSIFEASASREGYEKYEEYLRDGRFAIHIKYLRYEEKRAQKLKQPISSHGQQDESSRPLLFSESGFIGFYINVVPCKQNFFYNGEYSSIEEHNAYREILKENSATFKEKFADGQFIPGSESDLDGISSSRINTDATQINGRIVGVAKYRRIEDKQETQCPTFEHSGKSYEILSWQPIKKTGHGHYQLMGCFIDFADSYDPLQQPPQSLPDLPLQKKIDSIKARIDSLDEEINHNNNSCWASFFSFGWYEEKRIKQVKKKFLNELKSKYENPKKGDNVDIVNELAAEFMKKGQLQDVIAGVWRHETKDLMISLGYDANVALIKSKKLPESSRMIFG